MNVQYKQLEENYWQVSGGSLQRLSILNQSIVFYVIDPSLLNSLGYNKSSSVPTATMSANFAQTFSTDLIIPNAANYLQTNWTAKGWNVSTIGTFAQDMGTFAKINLTSGPLNTSLRDFNLLILYGTVSGQNYAVGLLHHGTGSANAGVYTPAVFPTGALGALNISNGQTVTLTTGGTYDYSSINIATGGTLQFTGGTGWTTLGCAGNCVVNGTIQSIQQPNVTNPVTATALDGRALSATLIRASGGGGSCPIPDSSCRNTAGSGGAGGGGGGGSGGLWFNPGCTGSFGGDATSGNATNGSGGSGGTAPVSGAAGGAGASTYGQNGSPGTSFSSGFFASGGGGGGAGYHGGLVYLVVRGNLSGSGSIDCRGQAGGSGGVGGSGAGSGSLNQSCLSCSSPGSGNASSGGGGGGGGSGGSGGSIVIRYGSGGLANLLVSAGSGGAGASGGVSDYRNSCSCCANPSTASGVGASGSSGTNGTTQTIQDSNI